MNCAQRNF